ncbi:L-type lectin-domain containing receptor kinase IX.1, partial [Bienertia sinuspersici]
DKRTNKTTNFTTHFSFNITQIADERTLYGDGLAFLLTPSTDLAAPDDSYGGCLGLFRNTSANAWITYDSSTKNLSVYLTYDDHPVFNGQSSLSYVIDLRDVLPETVRVGFSSATGTNYERHTILSWEFNSTLAVDDIDHATPPITDPIPSKNKAPLIGGVVAGITVIIIVLGLVVWQRRRYQRGTGSKDDINFVDDDDDDDDFDQETGPKRFTYNELSRATNNFSEEGKLGEGGFGGVYRGFLTDPNREIAVKKVSSGSKQGKKEYMSEVKIISRLRHKNLVQLLGWCHEQGNLLLVYEFMPNGSLNSHLYTSNKNPILPWETRFKIAQEDIKSSNIMLDSNFNAKLGDFGLARLVDHSIGSQTTVLAEHTYRPSIRQVINVLNFESHLPNLPLKFPVPIYNSLWQMNMSSFYPTSSGSSRLTGSNTGSSSQSVLSGSAPLLSDNVIVS